LKIIETYNSSDENKWTFIFNEIEDQLNKDEGSDNYEKLVQLFEKIEIKKREEKGIKYYPQMWKIALKAGKVKLANEYALFFMNYLIELKRIPAIKNLINEMQDAGLFKKNMNTGIIENLTGKITLSEGNYSKAHPENWKNTKDKLQQYLSENEVWTIDTWKLVYEFILMFHYDEEIFMLLTEKAILLNKENHKKNFITFLERKKVNLKVLNNEKKNIAGNEKGSISSTDYDQIALDLVSGITSPSITKQKKILVSIHKMTNVELQEQGKDMIVAFGLLGMDVVVIELCKKIIPLVDEVKKRAGLQFMLAQSLYNNRDYYKAVDLIDDVISTEPLLQEELMAFNYLKAESYLSLKKFELAKALYLKIKKINPNYRLIVDRLRNIETNK
jgi:hypothetical protein